MTNGYSRQRLMTKAIRKCNAMTDEQLKHFLGIFEINTPECIPLEEYSIRELVEITTYVPAIGKEFIGDTGVIVYFIYDKFPFTSARKLAGVQITKEDGEDIDDAGYIRLFPAERIRKTKGDHNEH